MSAVSHSLALYLLLARFLSLPVTALTSVCIFFRSPGSHTYTHLAPPCTFSLALTHSLPPSLGMLIKDTVATYSLPVTLSGFVLRCSSVPGLPACILVYSLFYHCDSVHSVSVSSDLFFFSHDQFVFFSLISKKLNFFITPVIRRENVLER